MWDGLLRNSLHIFRVSWIWFSARSGSRISRPVKYGSIHKMNRTRLLYIFSNMVIRHFIWNFSSDTWCIAVRFHLRANSVQLTNSAAACHHLTASRALINLPITTFAFRPKSWHCYWILLAVVLPIRRQCATVPWDWRLVTPLTSHQYGTRPHRQTDERIFLKTCNYWQHCTLDKISLLWEQQTCFQTQYFISMQQRITLRCETSISITAAKAWM